MLVRCNDGELALVDATANFGVGIFTMDSFVSKKEHEQFELVVYRHLVSKRSAEDAERFSQYLKVRPQLV